MFAKILAYPQTKDNISETRPRIGKKDKTRQNTRQNTRQDQTKQEKTKPDKTR